MEDLKKEVKAEMKAEIFQVMEEFREYFKAQEVFQSQVMQKILNLEEKVEALKVNEVKNDEDVENYMMGEMDEDVMVNIAKAVEKEVVIGEKDEVVEKDEAEKKEEKEKEENENKEKEENEKKEKEEKENEEKEEKEKEEKLKKEKEEKLKKEEDDKVKRVVFTHQGKKVVVKDDKVEEEEEKKNDKKRNLPELEVVQYKDSPPLAARRPRRKNTKIGNLYANVSKRPKTGPLKANNHLLKGYDDKDLYKKYEDWMSSIKPTPHLVPVNIDLVGKKNL